MCMYVFIMYYVYMYVYIYIYASMYLSIYLFLCIYLCTYMCMAKYSIQVDTFYYSVNCNTSPKSTVPEDLAISPSHVLFTYEFL